MRYRLMVIIWGIALFASLLTACDSEHQSGEQQESQMESQLKTKQEEATVSVNVVTKGCCYKKNLPYYTSDGTLFEGSELPEMPIRGDVYEDSINGYNYTYQQQIGENEYTPGWNVVYRYKDQYTNDYSGIILESICGQPVTSMVGCFEGRKAKMDPIVIPEHITDIRRMYKDCIRLSTAPQIPASVINMDYVFAGCERLTGEVVIDANPSTYAGCFERVDIEAQNIELKGKSGCIADIRATGAKGD